MGYSAIFVLRARMASRVKLFLAFVLNSLKTAETNISAQIFPLITKARKLFKSSGNAESLLASIKQKSAHFLVLTFLRMRSWVGGGQKILE